MDHVVEIPLRNTNVYDIEGRIEELQAIESWILELVDYDRSQYIALLKIRNNSILQAWFKEERHAIACQLRWS